MWNVSSQCVSVFQVNVGITHTINWDLDRISSLRNWQTQKSLEKYLDYYSRMDSTFGVDLGTITPYASFIIASCKAQGSISSQISHGRRAAQTCADILGFGYRCYRNCCSVCYLNILESSPGLYYNLSWQYVSYYHFTWLILYSLYFLIFSSRMLFSDPPYPFFH